MSLEEVARRAGVSTATVSRSLAGGKSKTLGVIVSNLENPFFFDIYKTIESDAHQTGYEVVMANTDYRPEQLVRPSV